MTPGDREALEALMRRIDHTAATAVLLADHSSLSAGMTDAVRGMGETLAEIAGKVDSILHPRLKSD